MAFYLFAAANLFSALYAPILDCDEVYNYWEPTHYLTHGYGFQTWEYSPEFSIRSWLYISLHAAIGKLSTLVVKNKVAEFYCIRGALALVCAACQARLFSAISRFLNPRIAFIFLVVAWSSPGAFHASTAYLPSSFAMYCNMLAMASLLNWQSRFNITSGVFWFGTGGIVGWPFSIALSLPFLLEEAFDAVITDDMFRLVERLFHGTMRCLIILVLEFFVDVFFYRKLVVVPWSIIKYNIFGGQSRGPDLFGTEPIDFYLRNLLLNFHVWFVLAFLAAPLMILQFWTAPKEISRLALLRGFTFTTPFYMWLVIFSTQEHKEERFMYPVYPFLALNASMALHTFLTWFGSTEKMSLPGKIPARVKLLMIGPLLLLSVQVGLLRIIGTIDAYRAPMQVYDLRKISPRPTSSDTICIGKEWYRFPSSYFLPDGVRAKFVKSEFDGLLPGEFKEARAGFGFFPGAWLMPANMNDQNIPDPSKLVRILLILIFSIANTCRQISSIAHT